MGALKIPAYLDLNAALLADDEPEHLDWLIDFLKTKGISTRVATNVSQAMSIAQQKLFRIYIIDLNIPLGDWQPSLAQTGKTYDDYHGLYIIKLIRTQGLPGKRVI
ncbi:MAG TPA: hypothetical protein PLV25_01670, partial [Opitutales bacterium]|nr:hypothetical protein [Opitutales bacterium]